MGVNSWTPTEIRSIGGFRNYRGSMEITAIDRPVIIKVRVLTRFRRLIQLVAIFRSDMTNEDQSSIGHQFERVV